MPGPTLPVPPVSSRAIVSWPRRFGAEMFGTFALVFVAAAGDTFAVMSGGMVSVAARAIAPGLIVAALIYALGDVSGAHFNPVVTLAFAVRRLLPLSWVAPYWIAQITGAVGAAALLRVMFGAASDAAVSNPHVAQGAAVTIEAILSLLLVTIIIGTADRYRVVGPEAALAVGATIATGGLIALPIEGASMNPARSLGPALVSGRLDDVWIYVVGPVAGAIAAAVVTLILHGDTESDDETKAAARGTDTTTGPTRPR